MTEPDQAAARRIPVEVQVPPGVVSRYATNLVIQRNGPEYIISFFEIRPPVFVGTPAEQRAQIEKLETIQAECVARVVVSAERMREFAQTFADSLGLDTASVMKKD